MGTCDLGSSMDFSKVKSKQPNNYVDFTENMGEYDHLFKEDFL